jgi:hypothetical protein
MTDSVANSGAHTHMTMNEKPNCYQCQYRRNCPGDCHSSCVNYRANVKGSSHGIRMGWFFWPLNFDPIWLESCDGFLAIETKKEAAPAQAEKEE